MKRIALMVFSLILFRASPGQDAETTYSAWLDSLNNQSYIAMEVMLDEMEFRVKGDGQSLVEDHLKYNHRSIDRMMHSLPGISMIRRGNFANEPMLRGMTSDRYVISIDGMRVFGACTDKMDPVSSYVEPVNLKSLNITHGTRGNLMGTSTGGAIDFSLKKPIFNPQKPVKAGIRSSFSSVNMGTSTSGDINWSSKKLAVRFSGVYRKSANYTDGDGKEVRYSQFEKINYAASASYRFNDKNMISLDFLGDDANDVGYPALPMDVAFARAKMFGLTYIGSRLGIFTQPEIKIYHNFIDHSMDDTKRDSVPMHMDMPGYTETTGAYFKGKLLELNAHALDIKADYYKNFSRAEMTMYPNEPNQLPMFMLTWPDINRWAAGLEASYRFKINEAHTFLSSTRWEFSNSYITSDFGEQQLSVFGKEGKKDRERHLKNFSLGVRRAFKSTGEGIFTVSYGERLPTISEQFGFYLFNRLDGYDYVGDPDINIEKNYHVEYSHNWSINPFDISVSVFSYFFRDYIMGVYSPELSNMTIGANGVKWYQNTERAFMTGSEVSTRYSLKSTYVAMNLKCVYGEDYEKDPLPQVPPLKINLLLDQKVKGFHVRPELEWSAAQKRNSEKFNERETPSYFLANFYLNRQVELNNLYFEFTAGIENLTNASYREHFDIGDILRPGRNIFIELSVRL